MLKNETKWWSGPAWMGEEILQIPSQPEHLTPCENERKKVPVVAFAATALETFMDLSRYSTLNRFVRVWCTVLREVNVLKGGKINDTNITPSEKATVLKMAILQEQRIAYPEELSLVEKGKAVSARSDLAQLYPFLDQGVLKVGGRLAFGEKALTKRMMLSDIAKVFDPGLHSLNIHRE